MGSGISFANFRRFWEVAARRNISGTRWASWPEPAEAQHTLEMNQRSRSALTAEFFNTIDPLQTSTIEASLSAISARPVSTVRQKAYFSTE